MNLANARRDEHIGELTLRRRRAGEALGPDGPAIDAHATACADCRARIRALDDEQRRFEQEISFDRFAAGVERAARGASGQCGAGRSSSSAWVAPMLAMAACVARWSRSCRARNGDGAAAADDRIKGDGGAASPCACAGVDGQRTARVDATEPLARGERLRIGYQAGTHRYLLALIDRRARRRARRSRRSRAPA